MNNKRRDKLKQAVSMLAKASSIVDGVRDEEQDSMDNIPENLQQTDRYVAMEDTINILDSALESISDAEDNIRESMR